MEQSPAPGLVPIPFGLSTPTFQDSNIITNNPELIQNPTPDSLQSRNALLNSLFTSADANKSLQQQLDFSENKKNKVNLFNTNLEKNTLN